MTDFVSLARAWIGTPYVHQASCRGAGCDCLGLLLGIWREAGGAPVAVPAYSKDWAEPAGDERLWRAATALLCPCEGAALRAGQVVLFRMRAGAVAKHLGLVSQAGTTPRFIHAMSGRGVIESPLSVPWRRRIAARFTFPAPYQGD